MLRGIFLISIISWYSYGVFKMINEYFLSEYKSYLSTEFRRNKNFKQGEEIPSKDQQQSEIKSFKMPNSQPDDVTHKDKSNEIKKIILENFKEDEEDNFVNYWLKREKMDSNVDANDGHCHIASDSKCEDN